MRVFDAVENREDRQGGAEVLRGLPGSDIASLTLALYLSGHTACIFRNHFAETVAGIHPFHKATPDGGETYPE
jgi:hypothetical protein